MSDAWKKRAEFTVNTNVTEQRKDTFTLHKQVHVCWKKEKMSFITAVGKDKFPRFQIIFGGVYKKIRWINPQIKSQFLMSIFEFYSANLVSNLFISPDGFFPSYHLALHANPCLRIQQRDPSARTSLWSQQDEAGFHSIFCLPLCHASLCRVEAERAAPRSSSTQAQPPELLSAHKFSERGQKRTAWIHAAPVFSQSSVPKRQGTFFRPRLR